MSIYYAPTDEFFPSEAEDRWEWAQLAALPEAQRPQSGGWVTDRSGRTRWVGLDEYERITAARERQERVA
jgi:hypothetical protein